jgi:CHAT domain-containing protein/tetratricopeptide (TPR) repeat protein
MCAGGELFNHCGGLKVILDLFTMLSTSANSGCEGDAPALAPTVHCPVQRMVMEKRGLIWNLHVGRCVCLFTLVTTILLASGSGLVFAQRPHRFSQRTRAAEGLVSRAEKAIAQAERLRAEWKRESLVSAAKRYSEAQSLLHLSRNFAREADVLRKLGDVQFILSEYQIAIDDYDRALQLLTESTDERLVADILVQIGKAYIEMANMNKALLYCERAWEISSRLSYQQGLAGVLNCLGVISYFSGDVLQAQEQFERASSISRQIKSKSELALAQLNLGYLHGNLGNMDLSARSYQQALTSFQEMNDRLKQALTLTALAGVYSQGGEKQQALNLHNQALKLFRTIGNRNGEAAALNGIGYWYDDLGNRTEALKCYTGALQLFESINNRHYAGVTLGYVARVLLAQGEKEKALQFFKQKLAISREVKDRRMESYTLRDIGNVFRSTNQNEEALTNYHLALGLSREVMDRRGSAHILASIGSVYEQRGERASALNYYEQALWLIRAVADRRGELQILYSLASVKRDLGRLAEARRDIEQSLELIQRLRTKITSPTLRIAYLESVYKHYEFYVSLLMQMHRQDPGEGYEVLALEVNDHGRAQTLLENLKLARTDIRQGVEPGLLAEERQLQQRLNQKAEQQTRLLSSKASPDAKAAITKEVETLLVQYKEIEARVREQSPKYAALTQPQPVNLATVQRELDPETLMLEYSLGTERSFGWAITANSVTSFELPSRTEIELAARALQKAVAESGPSGSGLSSPGVQIDRKSEAAHSAYTAAAARLSNLLLDPIAKLIPGKRLVIVADGALQYIPFTLLPDPGQAASGGGTRSPLLVSHDVVMLPSLSAITLLREELRGRDLAKKAVAVLADPVFQKDDPRVKFARDVHARFSATQQRSEVQVPIPDGSGGDETESGHLVFERLPFSLQEARSILRIASNGETKQALGFDASLQTALNPELRQYRVIHFATHAVLNNSYPELSGIVLSLVDQTGRTQNGFLRLNEIYNMNLSAELVVLSACQTALGKEARGEGLIGLTRGFMYAGVPRVIASLWRVNDRATAEFMRYFYEAMFNDNKPPSKALRAAQLKMWQSREWQSPQYWAAFILQGEWR